MKKIQQKQGLRIVQYKSSYLKRTEFVAKTGKTVYISQEFHEKLSQIVFLLKKGKVTLSDYLHSVLKEHFKDYGEEMKNMYNNMNKPNF